MNSKEYMNEYMKRRYRERRSIFIVQLGGKCVDCGSVDNLQFDHVNCEEKEFDIAKRLASAPIDVLSNEIKKCVLRCEMCHIVKTSAEDNSVPHGGGLSGKKNCKCKPCRKRNNEYQRKLRLDKANGVARVGMARSTKSGSRKRREQNPVNS